MNTYECDERTREPAAQADEILIDEDSPVIAAELMPVAVFLGWHWGEVRPDREITAQAA